MGSACVADKSEEDIKNAKRSKNIEASLKKERRQDFIKLLLLGTGDSGKSTFVKQMKVIHKNGFSTQEIAKFQTVLRENCLNSMQRILQCENVKVADDKKKNTVMDATDLRECLSEIVDLWQDAGVKEGFRMKCEWNIQIPSTTPYFFDNASRFAAETFQPTDDDMFRAKLKTTGISEISFEFNKTNFTIVDVGGQRSERRKWLHCFDDVTSVIYLAALDEYDMKLEEDNSTNRMDESLRLFSEVSGSSFFRPSSWILFLNKSDIFAEKIKVKPLNSVFPEFTAPEDNDILDASQKFILDKYDHVFAGLRLYPHVTCAIDTGNVKKVFNAVRDTVVTGALDVAGF